jgi:hypothetical protein
VFGNNQIMGWTDLEAPSWLFSLSAIRLYGVVKLT